MITETPNQVHPARAGAADSFYHLSGRSLAGKVGNGAVCFVARSKAGGPNHWPALCD